MSRRLTVIAKTVFLLPDPVDPDQIEQAKLPITQQANQLLVDLYGDDLDTSNGESLEILTASLEHVAEDDFVDLSTYRDGYTASEN